jgi:hypothetical protein
VEEEEDFFFDRWMMMMRWSILRRRKKREVGPKERDGWKARFSLCGLRLSRRRLTSERASEKKKKK